MHTWPWPRTSNYRRVHARVITPCARWRLARVVVYHDLRVQSGIVTRDDRRIDVAFSSRCTSSRHAGVVARHPSGWGTSLLEGIFPLNEPIRARLFLLAPRPKSRRHHINKGWAWFEASDSHNGQIDVCRLVAMVIWLWTSNVANRGQNVCVGSTPTDTIGPRSRSSLSARWNLVVLKWRKNRSIFTGRRVFSFDIAQTDSFLCQPADEHNREAFACELTLSRLAKIIVRVNVSVTFENLLVVWMAYHITVRSHAFLC